MGAKSSKPKVSTASSSPRAARNGTSQTAVVSVDPQTDIEDEVALSQNHERMGKQTSNADPAAAAKSSTVQSILKGKSVVKDEQNRPLEHFPHTEDPVGSLDLQFSSSEESDNSDDGGGGGGSKKKRNGAKKKKKKKKKPKKTMHIGDPAPSSSSSSPVKRKLNDVKSPKKGGTALQAKENGTGEYFDQIKDAYALAEYTSKENVDIATQPRPPPLQLQSQQQQPPTPTKPSKQQPSPSSSPSKLFGGAFDGWRNPMRRAVERPSPIGTRAPSNPASAISQLSNQSSMKSISPRSGGRQLTSSGEEPELSDFELESTNLFHYQQAYAAFTLSRTQAIGVKIAEERNAVATTPRTATTPKDPLERRRSLRIDDMDESIMDDILAEVVT